MTTDDLAALETEALDPRYARIDQMSVAELTAVMNEADATVPLAVGRALPQITQAIEAAEKRMAAGGRLIYVGAGTPGRIGVLDASECPPTFGTPPELVFAIIAGGPAAVVSPIEGAEDDDEAGRAAIRDAGVAVNDTVVGIASSGRTPFVLGAIEEARAAGALTVGLSCNQGAALSAAAECAIEIEVGPEVLSGSTRLKAGTAQKLVANMFTTILMVRAGKSYGGYMVDVKATNHKLRERAVRMVADLAGTDPNVARDALVATGYEVKPAVVALRLGVDEQTARDRVAAAGGRLREALGE